MPKKITPTMIAILFLTLFLSLSTSMQSTFEPKEIIAEEDSLSTTSFFESNEAGTYAYSFQIQNYLTLKISLIHNETKVGEGSVTLFTISEEGDRVVQQAESFSFSYEDYIEFSIEPSEETYYLEYDYEKPHQILFKFCHFNNEVYTINEVDNKTNQEIFFYSNQTIYVAISQQNYNEGYPVPIKISGNFSAINNSFNYLDASYENIKNNPDTTIALIDQSKNYLEKKQLNEKTMIYYAKAKNQIHTFFKIEALDNGKSALRSINISVIRANQIDVSQIKNDEAIFFKNSLYSGDLFYIDAKTNLNENISLIIFTNVSNISEIITTKFESVSKYRYGDSLSIDGEVKLNDRLIVINIAPNVANPIEEIIISVNSLKEDYSVGIMRLKDGEIAINDFNERTERAGLIKEDLSFIINRYKKYDEVYLRFIDYIGVSKNKGKHFVIDFDNYDSKEKSIFSQGSAELIVIEETSNFHINEYYIKQKTEYNFKLKEGDFVQFGLAPEQETSITMPSNTDYKISLNINDRSEDQNYSIEFTDNDQKVTLDYNTLEHKSKWTSSTNMNVKNIGNQTALVFLKVAAKKSDIVFVNNSTDMTLKPNTLYALQMPDDKENALSYGVFQEIKLSTKVDNLCIFYEYIPDDLYTLPPNISCTNYSEGNFEFSLTKKIIEQTTEQGKFYTFVYFTENEGAKNTTILELYYKQIFLMIDNLQALIKFNVSKDIILYQLTEQEGKKNNKLFIQIIKKDINQNAQMSLFVFDQGDIAFVQEEKLPSEQKLIYHKFIDIQENTGSKLLQLNGTGEYEISYEFGEADDAEFVFNYIEDNSVVGQMGENNKFMLSFKPIEKEGAADYEIIAFPGSKYKLEDLRNPLFLLPSKILAEDILHVDFTGITSSKGDFSAEDKEKFSIVLPNEEETYYIMVYSAKLKPFAQKIYSPVSNERIETKREEILIKDSVEKRKCYDFNIITGQKLILTINKTEAKDDGALMIEWKNDAKVKSQIINIYKGIESSLDTLYSFGQDEYSYTLDTKKCSQSFEMSYIPSNNETAQKICFEYIPYEGKSDYDKSEIEYKFNCSLNLPYYVNSTQFSSNFEIFRFKYDKNDVEINHITIAYKDSKDKKIFNLNYDGSNVKDIGDGYYYFGMYSNEEKSSISLNIHINKLNNRTDESSVLIQRSRSTDYTNQENRQTITSNSTTQFYIVDLNKKLGQNDTLLLFTNLLASKAMKLFRGNLFLSPKVVEITKRFYSFVIKNITSSANNKTEDEMYNMLTIVLNSKDKKEGFLDLTTKKGQLIDTLEHCNRSELYNGTMILEGTEGSFIRICHYEKDENIKYEFKYKIEKDINSTALVNLYYTNNFDKSSVNDIMNDLSNRTISEDTNYTLQGEVEIFGFNYSNPDETSLNISMNGEEHPEEKKKEEEEPTEPEDESNVALIIVFSVVVVLVLIVAFVIVSRVCLKKPSSDDIEKEIKNISDKPLVEELK